MYYNIKNEIFKKRNTFQLKFVVEIIKCEIKLINKLSDRKNLIFSHIM